MWAIAAICVVLAGCGGGGGPETRPPAVGPVLAEPDHAQETIDTTLAVQAADPSGPFSASPEALAELRGLETSGPVTDSELRRSMTAFARLADADSGDIAAQMGLAVTLAAAGIVNGARLLGTELPDDIYVPVAPSQLAQKGLEAADGAQAPVKLALAAVEAAGPTGRRPAGADGQASTQALVPGELFTTQEVQAVLADLVLPAVRLSIDRMTDLVNNTPTDQVLMSYEEDEGDIWHLYRADVWSAATALRVVYAAGLVLNSYNWDFGTYDWEGDVMDKDANQDGVLGVAEYAPADPFFTLAADGAANMATALQMLQEAVQAARAILADFPSDTQSPVGDALRDENAGDLQDARSDLQSALQVLQGQVNIQIEYADYDWGTNEFSGHNIIQVPFNLPSFFSSPVPDLKDLLPPMYIVPEGSGQYAVHVSPDDLDDWVTFFVDSGEAHLWSGNGDFTNDQVTALDLRNRRVVLHGQQMDVTVNWNAACDRIWGTTSAGQTFDTVDTDFWGGDPRHLAVHRDDIPDRTFYGLFPSPNQVWDALVVGDPDLVIISYGTFEGDLSDDGVRWQWDNRP